MRLRARSARGCVKRVFLWVGGWVGGWLTLEGAGEIRPQSSGRLVGDLQGRGSRGWGVRGRGVRGGGGQEGGGGLRKRVRVKVKTMARLDSW